MKTRISENQSVASSFFSGVFVLSISTVIVKVIGLVYKIPMLSYLGAEGMGYFNSAYEIYALLCVISTAGLPTALSMLVSSYKEAGRVQRIKEVYKNALLLFLAIGVAGTSIMLAFARPISELIKNQDAFFSIIAIAPALLCVCVSSAVRGYFQGFSRMMPTAVSQLIEALGKLVFGILFALWAIRHGYAVPVVAAFAILGLSLGTLISAVYLIVLKLKSRVRVADGSSFLQEKKTGCDRPMRMLLKIALPITLSSAVISVTRIIDMTLIMRRLQDIGYTSGVANEIYGVYTTVAVPIFSLIPSLLTPISMSLVPALSGAIERDSHEHQAEIVRNAIKLTVFLAMPSSFAIILYSRPIISLLFFNIGDEIGYVSVLLSLLGSSVLFSCLITTTNAILQSYRKVNRPIISMAVGALVKVVFAYVLIGIPEVNVYGAPISTFLCDLTITVINLIYVYREGSRSALAISLYVKPLLSSSIALMLSFAVYTLLYYNTDNARLSFVCVVPIAIVFYFAFSFITKTITAEDISMLPMGDKICGAFNKIKHKRKATNNSGE